MSGSVIRFLFFLVYCFPIDERLSIGLQHRSSVNCHWDDQRTKRQKEIQDQFFEINGLHIPLENAHSQRTDLTCCSALRNRKYFCQRCVSAIQFDQN
jgi:hypothetical protein